MEKLRKISISRSRLQTISGGEYLPQNCELAIAEDKEITVTHKKGTAQPSLKLTGLGKIRYQEVDE